MTPPVRRQLTLLLAVVLSVSACDQLSKFWATGALTRAFEAEGAVTLAERGGAFLRMRHLEGLRREPLVLVEDHLRLRYLENPGAAWGFLGSLDERIRLPFFRWMPVGAIAIVLLLYLRATARQRLLRLSLALILGGALGNLADRWIHGYVIDFIDLHWGKSHWPTFNLADVAISAGMVGLICEALWLGRRRRFSDEADAQPVIVSDAAPDRREGDRERD